MHFPAARFPDLKDFLVSLARSGLPYSEGGRSLEDGIDCAGLVIAALEHLGATLTYDGRDDLRERWYDDARHGEELLAEIEKNFEVHLVPCPEPEPGDLLLFRMEGHQPIGHLAFMMDDGYMVHALNESRGICQNRVDSRFWAPLCAGWAAPRPEVW